KAEKSVLMVEDIANLVPLLYDKGGVYNVCDTKHSTFCELENIILKELGKKSVLSLPYWLVKCMALVGDCLGANAPINSIKLDKLVKSLTFSNEKARKILGWKPISVLENFKINKK
ncbi:MAG: NAD(P)-dependent oxidoreductase, partial [Rikenellaceae bacterium]